MSSDSPDAPIEQAEPYWQQARQPLACLVFLAPLLVTYEVGVLQLSQSGSASFRNGADYWMRGWLTQAGLNQTMLLPGLVVAVLLIWHACGRYRWRVSADTLIGMFAESLLFAFLLTALAQMQDFAFRHWNIKPLLATGGDVAARVVSFIGAGVYEEVLFRLLLLPMCYGLCRLMRIPNGWSAATAVLVTSLAFSLAHYIGPAADTWTLFNFTFRAMAGMFFAVLFVTRGFGITVGCHAAYDLLVGILLRGGE